MSYYSSNTPQSTGNTLSPSCQAALAAAAMFSTDHKNTPVSNVNYYNYSQVRAKPSPQNLQRPHKNDQNTRNISPNVAYRINQQHQQLQKPLSHQPQRVIHINSQSSINRPAQDQSSAYSTDRQQDASSSSSIYKSPPPPPPRRSIPDQQSLLSPMPRKHTPTTASLLASPSASSTISSHSPQFIQHSSWNDINQTSSSTALAAAASIAKNNPNSFISTTTSPKLIRKKVAQNSTHPIVRSTLRKKSETYKIMNAIPRPISAILNDNHDNASMNTKNISPTKRGARKPPPPPRSSISESVHTILAPAPPVISYEHEPANTSFQFPIQENNGGAQSSISIPYPHSRTSSPTSSPQSAAHSIQNNTTEPQYLHSQEMHKRSTSKTKKLSNFFSTKPTKEEVKNQRIYNLQGSNSTSMLPSHMQQLSVNDSSVFNTDIFNPPVTAPPMNVSASSQGDYFSQTQDEFGNKGMYHNNNGSTGNIYQNSPAMSSSQQLVFRTTLRNSDKRSGFGRSRKSKTEFNEDKPWKNHERANLNMVSSDERKRYEGVFAANKSLYISLDMRLVEDANKSTLKPIKISKAPSENSVMTEPERSLSDFVNTYSTVNERIHGLVVREIWIRSKLDHDTLKKMWSLVLDDRKRRWLKTVSNGNTDWLPDEYYDYAPEYDESGITVDTTYNTTVDDSVVDDISTVNDETLRDRRQLLRNDDTLHDDISEVSTDVNDTTAEHEDDDDGSIRAKKMINGAIQNHSIVDEDVDKYGSIDADIDANSEISRDITEFIDHNVHNDSNHTLDHTNIDRVATDEETKPVEPPKTPQLQQQAQKKKLEPNENMALVEIDRNLFDDGTLTCDEFIVGMWLVDQCLYGRKIPKVVPLSVWETIGVDWTLGNAYQHHHTHVPVISGVGDIVGMGIKKGKKAGTRKVLKKVIGM